MTPNKEDYLKCIYDIVLQQEKVTNKLVSKMMNVSAPAVTEMLRKLLSGNLVVMDSESGYQLTQEGLLQVSKLVRKHRLLEVFLMEKLNYSIEEVHQEAEVLEHSVSDLFIEKLNELLGYPTQCPHGCSIPKQGELLDEKIVSLSKALVNKKYVVSKLSKKEEIISYLNEKGLHLTSEIEVLEQDLLAKLVKISVNHREIILSDVIADQVFLKLK